MGLDETKLRRLETTVGPVEASDLVREVVGRPPALQVDITDPPSPVRAHVSTADNDELLVEASDADAATMLLGREFVRVHREKARIAASKKREP